MIYPVLGLMVLQGITIHLPPVYDSFDLNGANYCHPWTMQLHMVDPDLVPCQKPKKWRVHLGIFIKLTLQMTPVVAVVRSLLETRPGPTLSLSWFIVGASVLTTNRWLYPYSTTVDISVLAYAMPIKIMHYIKWLQQSMPIHGEPKAITKTTA